MEAMPPMDNPHADGVPTDPEEVRQEAEAAATYQHEEQPKFVMPKWLSGLPMDMQLSPGQVYQPPAYPAPETYEQTIILGMLIGSHLYTMKRRHELVSIHVPAAIAQFVAGEHERRIEAKTWNGVPIVPTDENRIFVTCRPIQAQRTVPVVKSNKPSEAAADE